MALKASTGLRNAILAQDSFRGVMEAGNNCRLRIYDGAPPASADAAVPSGHSLLVEITVDGDGMTGLTFEDTASSGTIEKNGAEDWQGTVQNSGTAQYFRLVADGDDATESQSQPRLQGNIATVGAELNLSSVDLTETAVQPIDFFIVNLPTG